MSEPSSEGEHAAVIAEWLHARFMGGSNEEAEIVVEFLVGELVPSLSDQKLQRPEDLASIVGEWKHVLQLGASPSEEYSHYEELLSLLLSTGKEGNRNSGSDSDSSKEVADIGSENVEGVEEGCCEMCERPVQLTKHHLIPKETHTRMMKRGVEKEVLNRTINICRACHNAVHNVAANRVLATEYNTLEKLMQVEAIQRFVAWNAKQRPRAIIRRCKR